MANIYKNEKVDLTTASETVLYTVPNDSRAIVKSILVCNDQNSSGANIDVTLTNASGNVFSLFKSKTINANSTLDLITNPLILTENEQIKVQATTADRLHVILSMLQINRN